MMPTLIGVQRGIIIDLITTSFNNNNSNTKEQPYRRGDSRSHKLIYFLETIYLTSLAGIGKLPGPNDWWRIGTKRDNRDSEEMACKAEANEALVLNNTNQGLGRAKVVTKEWTTKAGLPGWEDVMNREVCCGRLDPTPIRDDICMP